ncbi:MAG: NADPH dehydrogenase NamA [Paenibacillaceae bacterium]
MLFTPFTIGNLELRNRIVMSPMCMYSCPHEDGKVMNWHKTHYSSRAVGQVGLVIVEASAVTEQGRISPIDLGIWSDDHVAGLRELVDLIHEHDGKIGIQLSHAGRKSNVEGPILAPSAIAFNEQYKVPTEMTIDQIEETIQSFKNAAVRAGKAGFDVIEIHAAHGYLINEFLSPLSNHRTDEYGGDRDRRYHLLGRVITAIKEDWDGPLFIRISAAEYHPEGNTLDDITYYTELMKQQGVDLIDCSSGGIVPASLDVYPGYQVQFAEHIRKQVKIATGAVGIITDALQANQILDNHQADLVFLGRELLRDPYWARRAAGQLNEIIEAPKQYERGWIS